MKKINIQIKSIFGKVLFEYSKENNTLKETVEKFIIENNNIVKNVDLSNLDLSGINFDNSRFYNSSFDHSSFDHSSLNDIKIKKIAFFYGLYKYSVIAILSEEKEQFVIMGCFNRTRKEWEKDFWNNRSEFQNDGSIGSKLRVFAFETACKWLDLQKEIK